MFKMSQSCHEAILSYPYKQLNKFVLYIGYEFILDHVNIETNFNHLFNTSSYIEVSCSETTLHPLWCGDLSNGYVRLVLGPSNA